MLRELVNMIKTITPFVDDEETKQKAEALTKKTEDKLKERSQETKFSIKKKQKNNRK